VSLIEIARVVFCVREISCRGVDAVVAGACLFCIQSVSTRVGSSTN